MTYGPGSGPIPTTRSVASEFPKEETNGARYLKEEGRESRILCGRAQGLCGFHVIRLWSAAPVPTPRGALLESTQTKSDH